MSGGHLWRLSDTELLDALTELETQHRRIYGQILDVLGELQTRPACEAEYPSLPHLLRDLLRISRKEANRRLAHAEAVTPVRTVSGPELPPPLAATAEAVRGGILGAEHLDTIHRTMISLPPTVTPDERESAEQILVEAAHTLDPGAIGKLGRNIQDRLDQDGDPPTDSELLYPANELRCTTLRNGRMKLVGELDVEGAALVTTVLSPLAKPRPAVEGQLDPRTHPERLGDALVEALRITANCGELPEEGGERPNLVVTVTLDALRDQLEPALLDGAGLMDARMARRLACDSNLIPMVLGSRGEPLDVGRKTRVIPTAIRRAVIHRDRACAFPNCAAKASRCDVHHVIPWAEGGLTAIHNLALLCGFHHRLLHHSDWEVRIEDGTPTFYPPRFIDRQRRPRRNPLHPRAG